MTNKLNHTDIPTVFLFGKENAYAWNPVRGCANHGCFLHPTNKGGCWASVACRLHAKPWAKSEAKWHRVKTNLNDGNPVTKEEIAADISGKLSNFEPTLFQSQLNKVFPKDRSCIFVCSQTDIALIPPEWLKKILEKIKANNQERESAGLPRHIWQFLTKSIFFYSSPNYRFFFPKNCWLGFTPITQTDINRISQQISQIKYRNNLVYLYIEPMINQLDISPAINYIDWVIVGGQNSPGAVPLHPEWVRSIRDKCQEYGVPLYFKGWGEFFPYKSYGETRFVPKKSVPKNLWDIIDGQTWHQFPEAN